MLPRGPYGPLGPVAPVDPVFPVAPVAPGPVERRLFTITSPYSDNNGLLMNVSRDDNNGLLMNVSRHDNNWLLCCAVFYRLIYNTAPF